MLTVDVYVTDDLTDDNVDRGGGDGMFLLGYLLFSYIASIDVNNFGGSTMSFAWRH
jgi:hypothetical protein